MTKQTKMKPTVKGANRPIKLSRQSPVDGPNHLFRIPLLRFRAELEHLAPNETWFTLGKWSHDYETDKDGPQIGRNGSRVRCIPARSEPGFTHDPFFLRRSAGEHSAVGCRVL